jgi:hypothetical protein
VKQNSFEICKNFYTETEIKQRGPISGARGGGGLCLGSHKLCEIGLRPPSGPPGGQNSGPGVSEYLLWLYRPPGLYPATRARATARGSRPPGRGALTWERGHRHRATGSQTTATRRGHLGAATRSPARDQGHQVTATGPRITANACAYLGAINCERMCLPGSD